MQDPSGEHMYIRTTPIYTKRFTPGDTQMNMWHTEEVLRIGTILAEITPK